MPNYRARVPGGYFSKRPDDDSTDPRTGRRIAVSIRMNNPGAINGASWEKDFPGFVETRVTTAGNATTIFESPEDGVAAWWSLMQRYRDDRRKPTNTVEGIIRRYGGDGQDYSDYVSFVTRQTGLKRSDTVDLNNDRTLLPFAKSMFYNEAGRSTPLHDEQIKYGFALARSYFAGSPTPLPPKIGDAPAIVEQDLTPAEYAEAVADATRAVGGKVFVGAQQVNIAYCEGRNPNGTRNQNRPDAWDDTRMAYAALPDGTYAVRGVWEATTEPGLFWTTHRMNPGGAFHIAPNLQQTAWRRGVYNGKPALRQVGMLKGSRDDNEDMRREGDEQVEGDDYGVHHHGGGDEPREHINRRSAGCQVGRSDAGHAQFMKITDSDERFIANPNFLYSSTVLTADVMDAAIAKVKARRGARKQQKTTKTNIAVGTGAAGAGAGVLAGRLGLPWWGIALILASVLIAGALAWVAYKRNEQERSP